jgi:xylene monooxygenase electron transfer component
MFAKLKQLFASPKHRVDVSFPGGTQTTWQAGARLPLLASALEAGVPLPYRCGAGTCSDCKARLVDGQIHPLADFALTLTAAELREGYILTCQSLPRTDLRLEVVAAPGGPERS